MVYDWERFRDVITRLYVEENRPVEDIIEFMRRRHGFTPSKRQYQTQFRTWNFPSRHGAAMNNERLVARIKELWERNLSHEEMHRVLTEEDGFHIKPRALLRVRRHHKWLLRAPSEKKDRARGATSQSPSPGLQQDEVLLDEQQHNGDSAGHGDGGAGFTLRPAAEEYDTDNGTNPVAAQLMDERRRKMETESLELWAAKKRRRRIRPYAGIPADPPGPPRFRSETTVAESLGILALDKALYGAVRDKFQGICEEMNVSKKTIAGPVIWDEAKTKLVAEFAHLQQVMWIGDDLEQKRLALDVICCDVTKRMRQAGDRGQKLADAKNILGMNPDELREVKAAFLQLLEDDGATSKVSLGNDRWEELKQRWIEESELLRAALARSYDPSEEKKRADAVETLASDAMKRLRDSRRQRKSHRAKGKAPADEEESMFLGDDGDVVMMGGMEGRSDFASILVPDQSHRARMPPAHLVDPQMHSGMQMPIHSNQLNPQLLMDPNEQANFMSSHQQFMSTPAPMGPMPQMAPMASMEGMPSEPSPYDDVQAAAFELPVSSMNPLAIYLQQVDHVGGPLGDTWIAWLTSPSLDELRQVAAQKLPGSTCTEVVGLVKMPLQNGMPEYFPLTLQDDQHLSAHLAQEAPHTFHVKLAF